MNLPAVIQILQIGVVGLAFLLAYMGYRILHSQSEKDSPNQSVLNATTKYMVFAVALGMIALLGQVAQAFFPAHVPSDIEGRLQTLSKRLDGIRLVAKDAGQSPGYACGNTQTTDVDSLKVMYGLRDGTSCSVTNVNFYKEIILEIPQ